jgi:hypothetical protein
MCAVTGGQRVGHTLSCAPASDVGYKYLSHMHLASLASSLLACCKQARFRAQAVGNNAHGPNTTNMPCRPVGARSLES